MFILFGKDVQFDYLFFRWVETTNQVMTIPNIKPWQKMGTFLFQEVPGDLIFREGGVGREVHGFKGATVEVV